jgi:hypothetical protein
MTALKADVTVCARALVGILYWYRGSWSTTSRLSREERLIFKPSSASLNRLLRNVMAGMFALTYKRPSVF